MISTPTTPTNAKNTAPCEKEGSAVVPTALIGATAEEEEEVENDGKTVALAKGGVTDLARTAGRTSLAREVGGTHLARGVGLISLARIAHKATQASLRSQGEKSTTIQTRGLGASRSLAPSPASWAELKP